MKQVEEPPHPGPTRRVNLGIRDRVSVGVVVGVRNRRIFFGFCAHKMHVADLDGFLVLFVAVPPTPPSPAPILAKMQLQLQLEMQLRYIYEIRSSVCVCVCVFDTLSVCSALCLPNLSFVYYLHTL